MRRLPSSVLDDPAYRVPQVPPGATGLAWLRTRVPRFADGTEHTRLRALTLAVVDELGDPAFVADPTRSLLTALGLSPDLAPDVALAAAAYQPHAPQTAAADAAANRLVAACGGRTDDAAAWAGVLVQAHAATVALVAALRAGSSGPPVPVTRRQAPDGEVVEVDLADAPFGRGAHRCPGEAMARRLAAQAVDTSP